MKKIALVGSPNSGKTTVFNGLTGLNQSVGNWPGVTVEKKSGKLRSGLFEAEIIDLPGIYSLSTISLEEAISSQFVIKRDMDLIINIVDASNLERNLFLTYQLLEADLPVVVALNCMDIVEKKLENINIDLLSESLGVPVFPITASRKHGMDGLIQFLKHDTYLPQEHRVTYPQDIEATIERFQSLIGSRFLAIRFIEDGLRALPPIDDKVRVKAILDQYHLEIKNYPIDLDMVIPNARYNLIMSVIEKVLSRPSFEMVSSTEKIDRILTHKWLGIPIFALIMFLVFFLAFGPIGVWITEGFVYLLDVLISWIISGVNQLGMAPWVESLIAKGVFGGLGAVVVFLPQLVILFLFLSLLEDSGYMARAAFIMDRALRRFGLSGKSFIPMLMGFGCSVPAMAATRTLDKDEDRKITTMIVPFISCGAKAPIYGVFAGALFFGSAYLVVFSMYLLGIMVAVISAIVFKKTILKSASANYIMELPEYRMPSAKNTFRHTWERAKGFLIKAGTILLGAFIIIWFFSHFGFIDGTFRLLMEEEIEFSLLGAIGKGLLPIFRPIGFTDWRSTVAILTGFVAKESVVGTLGILYGIGQDVVENGSLLFEPIRMAFTQLQAYAFMTFALLSTPCIAAIAAMKKELVSWKWLIFSIMYEMLVAYLVAFLIYQIGSLEIGMILTIIFAVIVVGIVILSIKKYVSRRGNICESCNGCGIKDQCQLPQNTENKSETDVNDGGNRP
jgi:ferrous iron transport protein B